MALDLRGDLVDLLGYLANLASSGHSYSLLSGLSLWVLLKIGKGGGPLLGTRPCVSPNRDEPEESERFGCSMRLTPTQKGRAQTVP